jgi:phosphoglycolate phosphatase-like HAD superfamily hydrolase
MQTKGLHLTRDLPYFQVLHSGPSICFDHPDCAKIVKLMERLILFDIDGTLVRTQNGYLPFNDAILKTFGIEGDIRTVVPDGNTDPLIVEDIFAKADRNIECKEADWQQFTVHLRERYHHYVQRGTTMIKALPGAAELARELALSEDFTPSIVTGNFEVTAEIKIKAAGLAPYLKRGAYASDSRRRSDLPAIAKRRWEERTGRKITDEQCIVVGDTPRDLTAARENHMKCILVGTGRYPIEELQYDEPDGCLADLTDTRAILTLLSSL